MAATVVFGPIYPAPPYKTSREVPRNLVEVPMAELPLQNLILAEDGATPLLMEDGMTFIILE